MPILATPSSMDRTGAGLSPSTKGTDNPAVQETEVPDFRLAFCMSGATPLRLQIVVQASVDGSQVDTTPYWKFKAVSSEGIWRFSSWCVA